LIQKQLDKFFKSGLSHNKAVAQNEKYADRTLILKNFLACRHIEPGYSKREIHVTICKERRYLNIFDGGIRIFGQRGVYSL
jgi:hypothetical protein